MQLIIAVSQVAILNEVRAEIWSSTSFWCVLRSLTTLHQQVIKSIFDNVSKVIAWQFQRIYTYRISAKHACSACVRAYQVVRWKSALMTPVDHSRYQEPIGMKLVTSLKALWLKVAMVSRLARKQFLVQVRLWPDTWWIMRVIATKTRSLTVQIMLVFTCSEKPSVGPDLLPRRTST